MKRTIFLLCIAFSLGIQAQTFETERTDTARTAYHHGAHWRGHRGGGHFRGETAVPLQPGDKALLESKSYDNWYIGVNGGAAVKTSHNAWMKHLNGNAGVRVGRWFTPAFGLALESNAYFSTRPGGSTGTAVQYLNTDLAATINISNWWFGYPGQPRLFEVIAVPALGMGHVFGTSARTEHNLNDMTAKLALDLAFNVDKKKSLQVYLEPAMLYAVFGNTSEYTKTCLNINRSHFQLNLGLVYKFKNTNGSHNFRYAGPGTVRDDGEIQRLNRRIADLEAENENLRNRPEKRLEPRIIERTQTVREGVIQFSQGSCDIETLQYATINKIAAYMEENPDSKVTLTGYASTEGSEELNQKLSEARAEAVQHVLITKFGIGDSRIDISGEGATDKYSDQLDYNRVVVYTLSE